MNIVDDIIRGMLESIEHKKDDVTFTRMEELGIPFDDHPTHYTTRVDQEKESRFYKDTHIVTFFGSPEISALDPNWNCKITLTLT